MPASQTIEQIIVEIIHNFDRVSTLQLTMGVFLTTTIIFLLTFTLAIWQPRKLDLGTIASAGAILTLMTGIIGTEEIALAWLSVGKPILTILAVTIITFILDEAGWFKVIANSLIRIRIIEGQQLLGLITILVILMTAIFNSYGCLLLLTPLIIETGKLLDFQPRLTLFYVLATNLIAHTSSLLLPQFNPINSIVTNFFHLPWLDYLLVMIPVHFVTLIVSLGVLWFFLAPYLPQTRINDLDHQTSEIELVRDPLICRWGWESIGLLILGCFWAEWSWLIASITALLMVGLAQRWFKKDTPIISLQQLRASLPWHVFFYSLGIFFVVIGWGKAGFVPLLSTIFTKLTDLGITLTATGIGFLATLLSGLTLNLPVSIINSQAIQDAFVTDRAISEIMIYANIIGCNIGAKISPFGSLETLLLLALLWRRGFRLRWLQYLRIHIALILPVLFISLLSLAIWLPWLIA